MVYRCGTQSKLEAAQVAAIRGRVDGGENIAALAREYGVSRQTLYRALDE